MVRFRRRPGRSSDATKPESDTATVSSPGADDSVIDLRDKLPPGPLTWGLPTRCPRCEDMAYLDRLDLVRRVMQLHCPTCHLHFEVSQDAIEFASQQRGDRG